MAHGCDRADQRSERRLVVRRDDRGFEHFAETFSCGVGVHARTAPSMRAGMTNATRPSGPSNDNGCSTDDALTVN